MPFDHLPVNSHYFNLKASLNRAYGDIARTLDLQMLGLEGNRDIVKPDVKANKCAQQPICLKSLLKLTAFFTEHAARFST